MHSCNYAAAGAASSAERLHKFNLLSVTSCMSHSGGRGNTADQLVDPTSEAARAVIHWRKQRQKKMLFYSKITMMTITKLLSGLVCNRK